MHRFLTLEAGNLTIALFFIMIALIVVTRPFVAKGFKKGLFLSTLLIFSLLIFGHYQLTSSRMDGVIEAFESGKEVICENRMHRKASQGLMISKATNWSLKNDLFTNPLYIRPFDAARCIVKEVPKLDLKQTK